MSPAPKAIAKGATFSYIDSVILRDRDNAGDSALEERRVYLQNWRADVVAVTRDDGLPLEYVRYSSYGEATVYPVADVNRDGVVNATDATEWDKLMAGTSNACAVDADLDRNGDAGTPDDQELFDASYAQHGGLSGVGRVSSASVGNRKGYAGYEWDETVAVYHVRHRVYLPEVGRWSRRDPLGYVDGMSLYEYVAGMAVRAVDWTGLTCSNGGCAMGSYPSLPPGLPQWPHGIPGPRGPIRLDNLPPLSPTPRPAHPHSPGAPSIRDPLDDVFGPEPGSGLFGGASFSAAICVPFGGLFVCLRPTITVAAGSCTCCGLNGCETAFYRQVTVCFELGLFLVPPTPIWRATAGGFVGPTCPNQGQDGCAGNFCFGASIGWGQWTVGCRFCFGDAGLQGLRCGLGVGSGTGASGASCVSCFKYDDPPICIQPW